MSDEVILCPYCMSPIEEDTVACPTCEMDTTNDAAFEMTADEYAHSPRKACRHCGEKLLKLAVMCPSCRTHQ